MRIKYFSDTDTALVEFSDRDVAETKEINENIYMDLDDSGNLVAMTIEHARHQANLPFLSYEQVEERSPSENNLDETTASLLRVGEEVAQEGVQVGVRQFRAA